MSNQRPDLGLIRGNTYFVVLNEGDVYQAEYRGFHEETQCYWFKPSRYAAAVDGPQWVYWRRIRAVIDLGAPICGTAFEEAINSILQ